MKNSDIYNEQNKNQDRKFKNQVNHLSGFIGMPMWNGRNPSLGEIREFDRRLIEKQAQEDKRKKQGLLKSMFESLKANSSNVSGFISSFKIKTKNIKNEVIRHGIRKHGISKSIKIKT